MVLGGRMPTAEIYPAGDREAHARFVRLASGVQLRVVEAGSATAEPIVIVPGWGCTAWLYRDAVRGLAHAGFRAIVVELKGQGLSDKPTAPDEYTLGSMRENLIDALDALSLPVAGLIGHSMGAAIAAHAAVAVSDRITGVALVAPVGFAGVAGLSIFRALTPDLSVPLLPYVAGRFVVKMMLDLVHGDLRAPTERDIDELRAPTQFPEYTGALRHLLHEFDWDSAFPRLPVPHIVIAGEKDHLSPARDAARYAADRPPFVIAGAGHVLFSEAPDAVNAELVRFFRSPRSPGYISS